jgi:hypothetical protein
MTNTIQEAVLPLVNEEDGDAGLLNYIDAVEQPIVLQDSDLEVVRIQRDVQGNVVVATTRKLPNLRFHLGDLLLEVVGSGMAVVGSLDQPLRLVLTGIRFLKTINKLTTIDVRKEDAEMLIAIFRLAQELKQVRVDDLDAVLPAGWDAARIAISLERLELLACIELTMEGITLNETILVQQRDESKVV